MNANRKGEGNLFNSCIDKKIYFVKWVFIKQTAILDKSYIKVEWSSYTTKSDTEKAAGTDTPKLAKKVELASLISGIQKLDIDELKTGPDNIKKFWLTLKNSAML